MAGGAPNRKRQTETSSNNIPRGPIWRPLTGRKADICLPYCPQGERDSRGISQNVMLCLYSLYSGMSWHHVSQNNMGLNQKHREVSFSHHLCYMKCNKGPCDSGVAPSPSLSPARRGLVGGGHRQFGAKESGLLTSIRGHIRLGRVEPRA